MRSPPSAPQAGGTTPSAAAVVTYMLLLSMVSGQEDITIGSIFANRASVRAWRTVGLFAHLVPLRLRLPTGLALRDLMRDGHQMMTHALAHQELPMSLLPAGALRREVALGINHVVVNVFPGGTAQSGPPQSGPPQSGPSVDGALVPAPGRPRQGSRFDFELGLFVSPGQLRGFVRYATDRFTAPWAQEFRDGLLELIEFAAGDVDRRLGDLTRLCGPRLERMRARAGA